MWRCYFCIVYCQSCYVLLVETSKLWAVYLLTLSQGWSAKVQFRACKGYRDPQSLSQAAQHQARLPCIAHIVNIVQWTNIQSTENLVLNFPCIYCKSSFILFSSCKAFVLLSKANKRDKCGSCGPSHNGKWNNNILIHPFQQMVGPQLAQMTRRSSKSIFYKCFHTNHQHGYTLRNNL